MTLNDALNIVRNAKSIDLIVAKKINNGEKRLCIPITTDVKKSLKKIFEDTYKKLMLRV